MLRKMHGVCLILEYFPPKLGSLKILPPPPKNNIDQGKVGGGVTMVPKSRGGSAVSKKVQNS